MFPNFLSNNLLIYMTATLFHNDTPGLTVDDSQVDYCQQQLFPAVMDF